MYMQGETKIENNAHVICAEDKQKALSVRRQKGVTLIELFVTVGIIAAIMFGLSKGTYIYAFYKGKHEGDVIANALGCARSSWTSPLFTGATLPSIANNSCFPDENTTGKGTATASATNTFGTAYTVAVTLIHVAGDGLAITSSNVPSDSCPAVVDAASAAADVITVGGTQVKGAGAAIDDAAKALQCKSASLVTVVASVSKSGN